MYHKIHVGSYYQHSPTRYGAYCDIFREKFIVCSKLLLRCLITVLKFYYTWVYNLNLQLFLKPYLVERKT